MSVQTIAQVSTPAAAALQVFPKQLLLSLLPPEVDILCTHPMFVSALTHCAIFL
jgi:hypothetical protein